MLKPIHTLLQQSIGDLRRPEFDAKRLKVLNRIEQRHQGLYRATTRRCARQHLIQRFKECCVDGQVGVVTWGRDCDGVEGTSMTVIDAVEVGDFDAYCDNMGKWADGPINFTLVPPDHEHQPWQHDRTLEAFENGHPWAI
jgi:hypothetical protein